MKCYGGPAEYINLRYNPSKESFELLARHDLMPNYAALVIFVKCYCAEQWLLKDVATAVRKSPSNDIDVPADL